MAMAGAKAALIVACSEYNDAKFRRLRAPAADASDLAEVLRNPQIGDYRVTEMINTPAHAANEEIEAFFQGRTGQDQLVLYFSCHGIKDDRGHLYFATETTKSDRLASTGISAAFVADQMYQSRARQIVLLLDCCYSGAFTRGLLHHAGDKVDLDSFAARGHAVLFASSAMEYAFELDGSGLSGSGVASLFTRTIVHGLRTGEADRDGDGLVSVEELYDHVLTQVRTLTPKQTPGKLIDTYGDIYIARSVRGASGALPAEIRAAVSSPLAGVRKGVIDELEPLLISGDPDTRHAARAALNQLLSDENARVAAAASSALGLSLREPSRLKDSGSQPDRGRSAPEAGKHQSTENLMEFGGSKSPPWEPASHPSKQKPLTGNDDLARWVEQKQFSTTRLRIGYNEGEVDKFLDSVQDTFSGKRNPPLTPADIRNAQFSSTRIRPGYDEEEVDAFLDEVELRLSELPSSESKGHVQGDGV